MAPRGQTNSPGAGSGIGSIIGRKQAPVCTMKALLAKSRRVGGEPMSVSPKSQITRPSARSTGRPPSLAIHPAVLAERSPSNAAWYSTAFDGVDVWQYTVGGSSGAADAADG